jgi:hypothetical protein
MQQWVTTSMRGALWTLSLITLASAGCSGPPTITTYEEPGSGEVPSFDPRAPGAAIVCDGSGDEETADPEIYVVAAMNAKLDHYPEFASAAGLVSVSDCVGARSFMTALSEYRGAHAGFDADQPLVLDSRPDPELPPPEPDAGEIEKVLNGSVVVNTPVVQLIFQNQASGHSSWGSVRGATGRCSGTFIAKNWILTAAHCLRRVSIEKCLSDGVSRDQCNPEFLTYSPKWKLRFPIQAPNGDLTWFELEKMGAVGYVHPAWPGMTPAHHKLICTTTNCADPEPGGPWDIALLYLPDDTRLPPEVELNGAKRLSVVPPQASWPLDFYGWGKPSGSVEGDDQYDGESVLRTSVIRPEYSLSNGMIVATKEFEIDSITCGGDSGGPLVRRLTLPTNVGNQEVEVIVGINSWGFGINGPKTCTPPGVVGDFSQFVPVNTHIGFIEGNMRRWPGFRTYNCRRRAVVGTTAPNVAAECWGTPCDNYGLLSASNPRACSASEFCSRPGREFISRGINRCDTCGTANSCDCIVGQCIAKP